MKNANRLQPNELADIKKVALSTISSLVKIADKHNIDRDSLMEYFATMFTNVVEVSTFKDFPTDEQKDNKVFTCKDCIHYDVCVIVENSTDIDNDYLTDFDCDDFVPKQTP